MCETILLCLPKAHALVSEYMTLPPVDQLVDHIPPFPSPGTLISRKIAYQRSFPELQIIVSGPHTYHSKTALRSRVPWNTWNLRLAFER
jgi:hypothetical protein